MHRFEPAKLEVHIEVVHWIGWHATQGKGTKIPLLNFAPKPTPHLCWSGEGPIHPKAVPLPPAPAWLALMQAAYICTSNFAGAYPSSPIGEAE